MTVRLSKVGVIGAGTMGRAIAAHLANAGIPSLLLDIVPRELTEAEDKQGLTLESRQVRDRFARGGLEQALKDKPAAFYDKARRSLIEIGNTEDDLERLGECDWIVEAALERLDIKQAIFSKVAAVRRPGSIVSSNTSGIPIRDILAADGIDEDFRKHFLVTHFFNPVRYMRLLELVPGEETDPVVLAGFSDFGARRLGKGIVVGKDTPNFIANRIGVFGFMNVMGAMLDAELDVTTVDAIVGAPMARPKTGVYRLGDMVGLDVLLHVADNVYEGCPDDEAREQFVPPDFLKKMVDNGWLGSKSGQGFYRKVKTDAGKEILQLDVHTLEYGARPKVRFPSTGRARNIDDPGKRLKMMVEADDPAGKFAWRTLSETLCYSARRIPEISDDITAVDEALRWGFAWDLGPFESWDAIGLKESLERIESEGREVPELAKQAADAGGFYAVADGRPVYFDVGAGAHRPVQPPAGHILLKDEKAAGKVVKKNLSCSLIDLGDGVLCVEFHSKMNSLDDDIIKLMGEAVDLAERDFTGLVVANDAQHFSAGANVMLVLMAAQQKKWDDIDGIIRAFQGANQRLRFAGVPTVSAPSGMALGGGAEVAMGAARMRAHAELYMGLVEIGVGLVPAGGGCKELVRRITSGIPDGAVCDVFPFVRKAFETIGMAKVSMSAEEARDNGFLCAADRITLGRGRLIHDAKADVLAMAEAGYRPPLPASIPAAGAGSRANLLLGLNEWAETGVITEHEATIGGKLAHILCGGDAPAGALVSEEHLLDLEREAFVSLCGEPKTLERIQHFLMKGKPLRN